MMLLMVHAVNLVLNLGSVDVLLDLVEINMGISMLPNHVVQQKMQEGTIVRIDTDIPVPTRDIVLVRSRLVPQSEGAATIYFLASES